MANNQRTKNQRIIDISLAVTNDMPVWPGSVGINLDRAKSIENGDSANVSTLECDVHTGTHVDAPCHFLQNAECTESLSLEKMIGPVYVADMKEITSISSKELGVIKLPPGTKRILFRTRNSLLWKEGIKEFQKNYVALTADAARWLVAYGIELVGVDYLSVQRYQDDPATHHILLKAGVVIVEGLNLWDVQEGSYEIICLPIRLVGSDGAPARVVLRQI